MILFFGMRLASLKMQSIKTVKIEGLEVSVQNLQGLPNLKGFGIGMALFREVLTYFGEPRIRGFKGVYNFNQHWQQSVHDIRQAIINDDRYLITLLC
ncbi:MAG: hypothetical protein DRR19_12540 [Candidatus Parabeggiatoa sp. nov. 1]|nr:MAG: hypothetical protein DRR19_12540 [Gammaproteobacteria bacterium]